MPHRVQNKQPALCKEEAENHFAASALFCRLNSYRIVVYMPWQARPKHICFCCAKSYFCQRPKADKGAGFRLAMPMFGLQAAGSPACSSLPLITRTGL